MLNYIFPKYLIIFFFNIIFFFLQLLVSNILCFIVDASDVNCITRIGQKTIAQMLNMIFKNVFLYQNCMLLTSLTGMVSWDWDWLEWVLNDRSEEHGVAKANYWHFLTWFLFFYYKKTCFCSFHRTITLRMMSNNRSTAHPTVLYMYDQFLNRYVTPQMKKLSVILLAGCLIFWGGFLR